MPATAPAEHCGRRPCRRQRQLDTVGGGHAGDSASWTPWEAAMPATAPAAKCAERGDNRPSLNN